MRRKRYAAGYEEGERRLPEDERAGERYENPPLEFVLARTVVERGRALSFSQEKLVRVAGMSQAWIWRIESRRANLRLTTLQSLGGVLGFTF